VLVTGGTGILGRNLVKRALGCGCDTYFTYRDINKYNNLVVQREIDDPSLFQKGIYLDLTEVESSHHQEHLQSLPLFDNCDEYVLINNVGIGLIGKEEQQALRTSIQINCLATISIAEFLVNKFSEVVISRSTRPSRLTVVHVSSGDGELLFLHSNVKRRIESLQSIKVSNIHVLNKFS